MRRKEVCVRISRKVVQLFGSADAFKGKKVLMYSAVFWCWYPLSWAHGQSLTEMILGQHHLRWAVLMSSEMDSADII